MRENDIFRFKHFSIRQNLCAMKAGTDGVLLGAWVIGTDPKFALDVGTGTGLLALMLAQKFPGICVDAIDIDEKAYSQALINIQLCELRGSQKRVQIFESSLEEWKKSTGKKYDLIICNPPYFMKGFPVQNKERNKARVAENLTQDSLLGATKHLLTDRGSLQVIYPVEEGKAFLDKSANFGFYCKRSTTVFAKVNQAPKRMLFDFVQYECNTLKEELIIEYAEQHAYTEEYKLLTSNFYLNF